MVYCLVCFNLGNIFIYYSSTPKLDQDAMTMSKVPMMGHRDVDPNPSTMGHQTAGLEDPSCIGSDATSAFEPNAIDRAASLKNSGQYDNSVSSSSDLEKNKEGSREHIFLGEPMSIAHELAFFFIVATANFTPRQSTSLPSIHRSISSPSQSFAKWSSSR